MNAPIMPHSQLPPQPLAEASAAAMWARDAAPQALGMALCAVSPGHATVAMSVRADMCNGHQTCHGGLIFTLADTAFAYACNSRNKTTVAAAASIDFLSPAHVGERLVAEASEQSLSGRTGVYDVSVRTDSGRLVALFRGKSHRLNGDVIPHPDSNNT